MQKICRVLKVFLASPEDVAEERSAADEVAARVNRKIGRQIGWQVDLYKWEDKTPGFGRPQELINEWVDDCGLFVGLLWKRWGQPTGKYSSGFEEEFERAKARRNERLEPEVWLFFKTVDGETLKDPGPQLEKVIKFRQSQINLRDILFDEIRDIGEWKTRLFEGLSELLLKLSDSERVAKLQETSVVPVVNAANTEIEIASGSVHLEEVPNQLKNVLSLSTRAVESGELEFSRDDAKFLQEFEIVRLYLLSATWMSRRYTGEVLGTHEMNLLYRHRKELELTTAELYQLFRTIVGSDGDLVPGWFWFSSFAPSLVKSWLLTMVNAESEGIRCSALRMLANAGIEIEKNAWGELPFHDGSAAVRERAFDYAIRVGGADALPLFDSLESHADESYAEEIREARFRLLLRLNPSKALANAITKDEYISDSELKILDSSFSTVEDSVLLKGVRNPSDRVRRLSLRELSRRGRLPLPIATEMTHDPTISVRATAFECLAKAGALSDLGELRRSLSNEVSATPANVGLSALMFGQSPQVEPDPDSIIITFYRTRVVESLLLDVDWYSVNGHLAYQALVLDHYKEFASQFRADLQDGFSRIKRESFERKEAEYGAEIWGRAAPDFDRYDESVKNWFAISLLTALATSGESRDVVLARSYLSDTDIFLRKAAQRVVCRFGTAGDLDELLRIATDTWDELRQLAARAALRVSAEPVEVAYQLIENSDSEVRKIAFEWLSNQESPETMAFFLGLLRDKNDTNRLRAVRYYARRSKRDELQQLLESYITAETYFYDVVALLDRLVYAPKPLDEMFRSHLLQKAGTPEE